MSRNFHSWLVALLAIGAFITQTSAQVTVTTTSSNWSNDGNWSNSAHTISSTSTVNHDMTLDADVEIEGSLTVNGTSIDLAGGGQYKITAQANGVMVVDGNVTIEGEVLFKDLSDLTVKGCDTLEVGSAKFSNNSTITIEPCGVLWIHGDMLLENDNGITCDGQILVDGDVLAKNEAVLSGSGSLVAAGTVTIDDNATIFGGTSNCGSPPCVLGTPLPIELLSFTAEPDNSRVILEWMTATELNNDYFTIERSKNGLTFDRIATVPGAGDSQQELEYLEYDHEPLPGLSYYRLKQTDLDGASETFAMVPVDRRTADGPGCTLSVRPNPCPGNCDVVLDDCDEATADGINVKVIDASGRVINSYVPNRNMDGGFNFHMELDNNLAPGIYIVQAESIQEAYTQKMMLN